MKKFSISFNVMLLFCMVPYVVFGASGSAIIPYYFKTDTSTCQLHITNISGETVSVRVYLFDTQGKPYTRNITFAYGFSHNPVLNPTLLASKSMGMISINPGLPGPGYGHIEWTNSSPHVIQTLVAHLHCFIRVDGVTGQVSIPINGTNSF